MSPRAAASTRCHLAYRGGALPTELPRAGAGREPNLAWSKGCERVALETKFGDFGEDRQKNRI
jgi:hypothetical protein